MCLAVMIASDMVSASAWRSEMPCCEGPDEWKVYSTGTLIFSSVSTVLRRTSRARVGRQQVEVTHGVERLGRVLVGEVIELELGAHVHDVAGLFGLAEHAAQAVSRISREGLCGPACTRRRRCGRHRRSRGAKAAPGTSRGRGKRACRFLRRGKALDGRAIETDALLEATSRSSGLMAKLSGGRVRRRTTGARSGCALLRRCAGRNRCSGSYPWMQPFPTKRQRSDRTVMAAHSAISMFRSDFP